MINALDTRTNTFPIFKIYILNIEIDQLAYSDSS